MSQTRQSRAIAKVVSGQTDEKKKEEFKQAVMRGDVKFVHDRVSHMDNEVITNLLNPFSQLSPKIAKLLAKHVDTEHKKYYLKEIASKEGKDYRDIIKYILLDPLITNEDLIEAIINATRRDNVQNAALLLKDHRISPESLDEVIELAEEMGLVDITTLVKKRKGQVPVLGLSGSEERVIGDDETCPICVENLKDSTIVKTQCGHLFHNACIQQWRVEKNNCPYCRAELVSLKEVIPTKESQPKRQKVSASAASAFRHKKSTKKMVKKSVKKSVKTSALDDRCYVVYGRGFDPLKIKGISNKNKLTDSLKTKGFYPKISLLNCDSKDGKKCRSTPTLYN